AGRLDEDATLAFVTCAVEAFEGASYVWTPSTPTLARVLAGEAPHPASLVRRELFDAVGGFAEELPLGLLEDLEFWIQALRRGYRGEVVARPLVRYRIRRGSIHQTAAAGDAHRQSMVALLARHRSLVEELGPELLLAKERQVEALRGHRRHLEGEVAERRAEIDGLRAERASLAAVGAEPLDFGDLRRLAPLSTVWGLERGQPLDRHYIETFLAGQREDIQGRVLEVKDAGYTRLFGGERVRRSDVLDVDAGNPDATVVADLCAATALATDTYDCFLLTQTLHVIYDLRAALAEAARVLKPGGVLLCTLPVLSRRNDEGEDFWRLTEAAAWRLFAEVFPAEAVEVTAYGNVLAGAAFLYGLSPDELRPEELAHRDPDFPVLLGVRAVKPLRPSQRRAGSHRPARGPAAILAYHHVGGGTPDRWRVSADAFRAQMEELARERQPLSLQGLVEALADGEVPEGAVVVTFDDGYLDTLTVAWPVLRELAIPATVFLTGEGLTVPQEPWWEVVDRVLVDGAPLPAELRLRELGGRTFATTEAEGRHLAREALREELAATTLERRQRLLAELVGWSGLTPSPRDSHRLLTAAEARELATYADIGCHTTHHLWLPRQTPAVQRQELQAGRTTLEQLLGRPVTTLAYPYGAVDAATLDLARAAGFAAALTVRPGAVHAGADPLLLPRYEIDGGDDGSLAAALRAARSTA
ncbi:MAG TPA: polysaccharide deacetylase family protein, partial [Thermoanaerobaculia bacterium]|nr:polysaccharide deacetylase family protein [Thermoanaerobaculia bacterium]